MRITIKDIAKATGVSVATVSLVLNDKPHKIAESTKILVKQKAKEMNYIPNQLARGLVKSKSKTIGFIIPDITNMYFAEMAKSVQKEARKRGYQVILCDTDQEPHTQEEYIKMLYENGVIGIIMAIGMNDDVQKARELMEKLHIKMVLIDSGCVDNQIDSITLNHKHGSYLATEYLVKMGHKKIGCITGTKEIASSNERLIGYKKALQDYQIAVNKEYIYEGDYKIQSGEEGAYDLLDKGVTAIYAFNDMMAYGVYKAAFKKHYRVPEDLSIMGFDNIEYSDILPIALTTIEQPIKEMGKKAVERMIEQIESKEALKAECYVFDPMLVVRESVKSYC